jgi:hypothetical protein
MADPKLVDMARTDADKKASQKRMEAMMESDGPDYPYGLCLDLCKEELDKLGLKDLPEVGDEFHIYAVAKVTRVSQSASESGDDSRGISLQIIEMGTMDADEDSDSPAGKLYSNRR